MTEPAEHPQQAEGKVVLGNGGEHLALASLEGEVNAGRIKDWMDGMRHLQMHRQEEALWTRTLERFIMACREWLKIFSAPVKEIAVKADSESSTLAIFVVLHPGQKSNLFLRRMVADLGLVVSGCFGVRSEARICSKRPDPVSFVLG